MSETHAHNRAAPTDENPVDWLQLPQDCLCWVMMYIFDMQDLDALRQCSHGWSTAVCYYAQSWRKRMRRQCSLPQDRGAWSLSLCVLPNGQFDGYAAVFFRRFSVSHRRAGTFFNGLYHGSIFETQHQINDPYSVPVSNSFTFYAGRPTDGWCGENLFYRGRLHATRISESSRAEWLHCQDGSMHIIHRDEPPVIVRRENVAVRLPSNSTFDDSWGQAEYTYTVTRQGRTARVVGFGALREWLRREYLARDY